MDRLQGNRWRSANGHQKLQKEALIRRFESFNSVKVARNKQGEWKQLKDLGPFNEDFQNIALEIMSNTIQELVDSYERSLKRFIWN